MIWKSVADRQKIVKWLACLPPAIWHRMMQDVDSPIWALDEHDPHILREVQILRSGKKGPTTIAVTDRLKRALKNPRILEKVNGSSKH